MNIRYLKQQRQKQRRDREIKSVINKALKRVGVGSLNATPAQQISALERYIADLRQIGDEMSEQYPGSDKQLWLIDHEIRSSIEAISKLRIEQARPE